MSALALIGGALTSLVGGLQQNQLQNQAFDKQVQAQKDLMRYQWNNFGSPLALAKSYAAAGFNPAAAMSNGSVSAAQPNAAAPAAPMYSTGIENLSEIGSYLMSIAQAKKAGVDTKVSEEEAKNKVIERQRNEFELEMRKYFGKSQMSLELAVAYQNLLLARDSHDLNEINKAIGEWNKAKAKAESESSEYNRDIVKKILDNKDTELKLANRESEARGTASYASAEASKASAEASRTQADVNRENRRLQSALADIEEGAKSAKIDALISQYEKEGWLSEADAAEARVRASRLHDVENKRDSKFFKAIDNYSEWLKSKLKIFSK